jgi:hypothetical protein
MNGKRNRLLLVYVIGILAVFLFLWPELVVLLNGKDPGIVNAQQGCTVLSDPKNLPSPVLINFDTLPNAKVIGTSYKASFGVTFEDSRTTQAIIYGNEPANAKSAPNVAINNAAVGISSANIPMNITFDTPKTHVGFWIGNGSGQQLTALVNVYNVDGGLLCQARYVNVPEPHTTFVGLAYPSAMISRVSIDYGNTAISESIDDLYFSPPAGMLPTRTPMPTSTPIPTAVPTAGPAPTATSIVPMYAYKPVQFSPQVFQAFTPDFSIHGIEITQAIQCFNTASGLGTCADNSLPVVNKKDSTARIYLKASNASSVFNNIPVRLYIRANSVWYTANSTGKTTTSINQVLNDSANVWFNVNFNSNVVVDFYAVVDPDNLYTESNESNNRYPAGSGYITLTFQTRKTMDIVGQRLRYHPSGYSGTQYAGGWAVNGGAADWFEQVLPIRNNGINYSVKSGYLDWTTSLGSGDGQHALIQTLNAQWMLENVFSWWFSGPFTGARHVYGWAPSAGYSGGHADMPVYPHAGGLGKVGIGSDAAGTNTDNPGSGALIFGHELVHDYNIYHTNTADACGSNDPNSLFPYSNSSIQEVGYNPITGKIYDPALTHDLMSYCPSGGSKLGWISPYTWNAMFTNVGLAAVPAANTPASAPPLTLYLTGAAESLQVNATVFNPANKPAPVVPGKLGNLYKTQGGIGFNPVPGNYSVQLRNAANVVLSTQTFAVNFNSEYSAHGGPQPVDPNDPNTSPPFPATPTTQVDVSFIIPWDPAAASITLMNGDQLLDQVFVSPNVPQVFITSPSGAEGWAAGSTHTLSWAGSDLDATPLSYSVFYSNNGGATWVLLASEISTSALDVQTDSLAGSSDVRFRVIVTDGVNTSQDETDEAISIPNKLPVATILNPIVNQAYQPGDLIVLQGMGVDLEDGTLPDEKLSWSSNKQGSLGMGPSVGLTSLVPGWHTITLKVVDQHGASASSSVTIFVGHRINIPNIRR